MIAKLKLSLTIETLHNIIGNFIIRPFNVDVLLCKIMTDTFDFEFDTGIENYWENEDYLFLICMILKDFNNDNWGKLENKFEEKGVNASKEYKIFEKYPLLACLYDDNNNKFQIPYILYYGSYSNYATFISAFGLPKQSPSSNLGPYYYFYTYHGAGKSGIWSYNRKEQIANDIEITRNEYGVYNHGGLIRFAIFGNNMKYFLNNHDDPDDPSEISQQLAKEKDFYKQTLKLRDSNAEWANNHDIAYIGSSMIKSIVRGEEIKRKYNIQFAVEIIINMFL